MGAVDLHTHSTKSDGEYSPTEVIRMADEAGVKLLSMTDHDTTHGLAEAESEARALGIDFVLGIEIGTRYEFGEQHLLGYCIDPDDADLEAVCTKIHGLRDDRLPRIVEYLNSQGIGLTADEIQAKTERKSVGRPHIAAVLLEDGYVSSIAEAFDKYLDRFHSFNQLKPAAEEAIAAIKSAGGVAVLAHPFTLTLTVDELDERVGQLKQMGLGGLECHYGRYAGQQTLTLLEIAKRHDLVVTGGSDFHGPNVKPGVMIGTGLNHLFEFNDLSVADRLRERAKAE